MIYEIMYQDNVVARIDRANGLVSDLKEQALPFDIFLTESDDFDDRVDHITNFNAWCAGRTLHLDRKYAKEILNFYGYPQKITDKDRADIALFSRCLSLNDCFWVRKKSEDICWDEVNLYQNSLKNVVLEVALLGRNLTLTNTEMVTPDLSTDGTAPKAWLRREDGFYLLKGDVEDSVKREVSASRILLDMGISVTEYTYGSFRGETVAECRCFTSEENQLISAGAYSVWCLNHDISFTESVYQYERDFELMNLGDYVVGNNDRHPDNWGFLYGKDRTVTEFAPVMDFDHAFLGGELETCQPMLLLGKRMTQEEYARDIAKKYKDSLHLQIDFTKYQYGSYVKKRLERIGLL